MSEKNFIEALKQRQEVKNQRRAKEGAEFHKLRAEKTIDLFHETVDQFIRYMIQNDFPGGSITTFENEEYISYPLYTTRRGDGEAYYWGTPVNLLIDGDGSPSYSIETERTGWPNNSTYVRSSPATVILPHTLEEYHSLSSQFESSWNNQHMEYNDRRIMQWIVELLYTVNFHDQRRENPEMIGMPYVYPEDEKSAIRKRLEAKYFPEGFEDYEYRRNLARKALDS